MSINSLIADITPRVDYVVGTTAQTTFQVPFRFFEDTDLVVYTGVDTAAAVNSTAKILNTDYSVTGAGLPSGGTIVFATGLTSSVVVIQRLVDLDKTGQFPLVGAFDVCTLNSELTRIVAMIQDSRDLIDRKFGLADPDTGIPVDVSDSVTRANGFMGFDASGNFGVFNVVTTGAATISSYILTLLDDVDAATARGTLGLGDIATLNVGVDALTEIPDTEDIQQQGGVYAVATGAVNTFAITLSAAPSAYADGQKFAFKANLAVTSSATLNVNALGAKTLKKVDTTGIVNLVSGDIKQDQIVEVVYESSNDWFQLLSPVAVSLATPVFTESYVSTAQTITTAGQIILAHGLASAPALIQLVLRCDVADGGYSINDEVIVNPATNEAGTGTTNVAQGVSTIKDATNITIRYSNGTNGFVLVRADTGQTLNITQTSWSLIVKAWA
jgi:hypothetical protein